MHNPNNYNMLGHLKSPMKTRWLKALCACTIKKKKNSNTFSQPNPSNYNRAHAPHAWTPKKTGSKHFSPENNTFLMHHYIVYSCWMITE